MKPYLSGAQKRKKKKEQETKTAKLTKIDMLFQPDRPSPSSINSGSGRTLEVKVSGSYRNPGSDIIEEIEAEPLNETDSDKDIKSCCTFNLSNKYPSDRYHFSENVADEIKEFIVKHGPCKPEGPFPKDPRQENRCFSNTYYDKVTKTGMRIPREWLCYSAQGDYVYCQSCWLFADRSSPFYHSNWVNGVKDWKGLTKKINVHETSSVHVRACVTLDLWKRRKTIDSSLESAIRKEENKWYKILHRIVNVTLTLASCNLAFRGHREEIGKPNSGNFLAVVELLAKYDHVLQDLLTNDPGNHRYLSPSIQNELIQILSEKVKSEVIKDICEA